MLLPLMFHTFPWQYEFTNTWLMKQKVKNTPIIIPVFMKTVWFYASHATSTWSPWMQWIVNNSEKLPVKGIIGMGLSGKRNNTTDPLKLGHPMALKQGWQTRGRAVLQFLCLCCSVPAPFLDGHVKRLTAFTPENKWSIHLPLRSRWNVLSDKLRTG